jgi:hypothetical protein
MNDHDDEDDTMFSVSCMFDAYHSKKVKYLSIQDIELQLYTIGDDPGYVIIEYLLSSYIVLRF